MHRIEKRVLHVTVLLTTAWFSLGALGQGVPLPLNTGDIDGNGERDVLDVSCFAATVLSEMQGADAPGCLAFAIPDVDLQCDNSLDVTDVQRSILLVLYGLTSDPGVADLLDNKDPDLDLMHNGCDPDDDNDLFPDLCEVEQQTSPIDANDFPLLANACTCPGGCLIADTCYSDGDPNAESDCEICNSSANANGWSPLSGLSCDDGNLCTADDSCLDGVCVGGDSVTCSTGGECEGSTCIPEVGCVVLPSSGGPCDDGNLCTVDSVCDNGVCQAGVPIDCDDNDPCTEDSCDLTVGCQTGSAPDGTVCSDGDECTVGDACLEGMCMSGATSPDCAAPNGAICNVSGEIGDTVDCLVRVARATSQTPKPSGIQLNLVYDSASIAPVAVLDKFCQNGGTDCFDIEVPPAALYPSGHSVSLAPSSVTNWEGEGTLVIANAGAPTVPLTEASYDLMDPDNGDEGGILRVRFEVTEAIGTEGIFIFVEGAIGSTSAAASMSAEVIGGIVVLSGGNCLAASECNDGNDCTTDLCDGGTCSYLAYQGPCDDGNECTGPDNCTLGSCEGPALSCDDNDTCTTDTCLWGVGCVHGPIFLDCDDGDECTLDQCDPATGGCSNSPAPDGTPCIDGNECTYNDICGAGVCSGEALGGESGGCHSLNNPICVVSGIENEIVDCEIHVARNGYGTPVPTALQASIVFDAYKLSLVEVVDEICIGQVCFVTSVPPASLYPSGHTVQLAPSLAADWNGQGTLIVSNPSSPTSALTTAFQEGPGASLEGGDAHVITLRLRVLEGTTAGHPVGVWDGAGSTASGAPMGAVVQDKTILLTAQGCAVNPTVCNDGISCKESTCEVGTSCCEAGSSPGCDQPTCEDAVCALDPFCCDEAWDVWCVACALGDMGINGNDCSTIGATCALSCEHSSAGDCVYTLDDGMCDDGDSCTANVCDTSQGCQVSEPLCGP